MAGPYSYRRDPSVPIFTDDKPLIVFDGDCILCSSSAQLVLRHDHAGVFRLAAAQSRLGQALYRHYDLNPTDYDTFLLVAEGRAHLRSDAALRIAKRLGSPWSAAVVLRLLPEGWRDRLYDAVARRRYALFGRRDSCFRPGAAFAARFLE